MSLFYKLLVISRGHQPENVYNLLAAARKREPTLCTKVQRAIPIPTTYSPKKKAQNCWLTTLPAMCLSNTLQKMGIMTSTHNYSALRKHHARCKLKCICGYLTSNSRVSYLSNWTFVCR